MEVTVTGDGATDSINLGEGVFVATIEATTWDGASATLQETVGENFVNSDDPYSTGTALTRTANDKSFVVAGGCKYRLNVSSFGSTVGLRLIINKSSK